jgi:hypothetical protein
MLPSSRNLYKREPEDNDTTLYHNVSRFYKKKEVNIPTKVEEIRKKVENADADGDIDNLYDLEPTYISSNISNISNMLSNSSKSEHDDDSIKSYNTHLSIKKQKIHNIKYPFSDKSSSHLIRDVDNIHTIGDASDANDTNTTIELCIYHINKISYKPFLEFMLYKTSEDNFYFPNYIQPHDKYDILDKASFLLDSLFDTKCEFKGRIVESSIMNNVKSAQINDRIILLYELKEKDNSMKRMKNEDKFWWATVSEIYNFRKILFYDISNSVIDVFLSYPQMIQIYYKDSLVETPMVVFNGNNSNIAKYNAIFSLNKSNNESRYGPFYYFTDLYNSMKYACYNLQTEKYDKGGLVRFIIFPGKIKMFLQQNKPDKSEMAKYIYNKNPIEKYTAQFRDNDCKWNDLYNSAYNGSYTIKINSIDDKSERGEHSEHSEHKDASERQDYYESYNSASSSSEINSLYVGDKNIDEDNNTYHLGMRICIDEYIFQTPLSYYYIDTTNIPDNYEYSFKNYKIK